MHHFSYVHSLGFELVPTQEIPSACKDRQVWKDGREEAEDGLGRASMNRAGSSRVPAWLV